jgi:hypothetical protein
MNLETNLHLRQSHASTVDRHDVLFSNAVERETCELGSIRPAGVLSDRVEGAHSARRARDTRLHYQRGQ